ncbi:MAG: ThiF family adenylyltransferase [Immundisolibacteraceae bacterium]|nr:ThiF family adenylyltransferase [Immundisolibacteraceae bacterium]
MFQKLVSHNDDLQRLIEKGYAVAFDTNCLVIRDIPYLDDRLEKQIGAIVVKLTFIDNIRFEQEDHQIYFAGSVPHNLDGKPIPNLGGNAHTISLSEACCDVVVQRSFSNKPKSAKKYDDHFHKIETYVGFISGPAEHLYSVSPYTFRTFDETPENSVFKFHDTLTTRAEITDLSNKLENDVVAIIGLGGTGAYVLDYLVKTPVREIRGYDHDKYHVHNVYRSPGRLDESELSVSKADVYQARYDNFRTGLHLETKFIDASCVGDLDGVTFGFVCVDDGTARAEIVDVLFEANIPFIDVGMGLKRKNGALTGMMRTTYFPPENAQKIRDKKWVSEQEDPENIYKTNIQICELNALNASLAVIRFKQLRGFYYEEEIYFNTLFNIGSLSTMRETCLDNAD